MFQKKRMPREIMIPLLVAAIFAVVLRIFVFEQTMVDGSSMRPTLHSHDYVLVNKLIYRVRMPHRFDIVVFHVESQPDYIRRVVGLPGEMVEYKQDVLYINGKSVDEPFLSKAHENLTSLYTHNFKIKVPKGTVFVLGDNRREGGDSRDLGPIPITQIVGESAFVF